MKTYKEMASRVLERRDEYEKKRKEVIKFSAVFAAGVACLCLVAVLGFDLFFEKTPAQIAQGESASQSESEIQMSGDHDVFLPAFFINDLEKIPAAASRLYFDPDLYDKVYYTEGETSDYFGKELVPDGAVRSPLKKVNDGGSVHYIEKDSGKVVFDSACIEFANDFYSDGSPLSPVSGGTNLTVWASRIGRPNICYEWGSGKSTQVNGIEVYAGKIKVGYDYNEQKEPQNFYTTYFAEFNVNGIYYEVTADNLSETEFIRAVWGIIAY